MQSKITLKRFGGLLKKTFTALCLLCLVGTINAQTYVSGLVGTGTVANDGTVAPTGFQWHEIQNDAGDLTVANEDLAFTNSGAYSVADDFTVPAGEIWTINKMTFYAIQASPSSITGLYVRIYDGKPGDGGTLIFGDLTTNRLIGTSPAKIYGTFNTLVPPSSPVTDYPATNLDANVNKSLTAGTYWVEWKVVSAGFTYTLTSQKVGFRSQPGDNAVQYDGSSWTDLEDLGIDQDFNEAGIPVPVGLPFKFNYTTGTCAGAPAPGNAVAPSASICAGIPFTVSLQNIVPGAGVTYQWQAAPLATGVFADVAGATEASLTTTLSTATIFHAIVTCGGVSTTSGADTVTVNPYTQCYCIPTAVNCNLDDQIQNVTIGTLNNTSTCSANGYTNYSTNSAIPVPDVIQGGSNPIKVKVGPGGTEYVAVWIDYNKNGLFDASEYTLLGNGNGVVISSAIPVPASAQLGITRMRVRVQYSAIPTATQACAATSSYGEVEDYNVNIVPCVPITFATQPANATAACGAATTFTASVTGSLPVYQWEYRTSATGNWINVPNGTVYTGANTATLTVPIATYDLNGYQYRLTVSGACSGVDFSTAATLTVNPLVAAVTPSNGVICEGGIQQLSITNTQPATVVTFSATAGLTIPDDGSTTGVKSTIAVTGIPAGVTIASIKIKPVVTHSWAGDLIIVAKAPNAKVLNLAYALNATGGASSTTTFTPTFSSTAGAVYTNSGSGTYSGTYAADGYDEATGDPTIPTGPDGYLPTSTATTRNTFADLYTSAANSSTLNGTWTLAMYDYYPDGTTSNKFDSWSIEITYTGGLASGIWGSPTPNSLYLDPAATIPYDSTAQNTVYAKPTTIGATSYTVVVNNGVCISAVDTVTVTVNQPLTGTSTTVSQSVCDGGTVSFTSTAPATGTVSHQWRVSTDGGASYTDLPDGGVYSGTSTNILTITGATGSMNGYLYEDSLYVTSCPAFTITNAATLTVNPLPVVVLSASPTTALFPGRTTTITAAVSPNAGASYAWYRNDLLIAGATTNTIPGITVDGLGNYKVVVTDVNGCVGTSGTITITDSSNATLFIYPSPTTGQFQVRYQSAAGNFNLPRTITVFDSKGAKILTKGYSINTPYSKMDVDLTNYPKGIYRIELSDASGNRMKTGTVIKL